MAFKAKEDRGSTMVEAAVVFPLVILTVFVLIYTMAFLFDQVSVSSAAHRATLAVAGEESGTYGAESQGAGVITSGGREGLRSVIYGEKKARFRGGMPGVGPRIRMMQSRSYVLDEKKEIRLWDVMR